MKRLLILICVLFVSIMSVSAQDNLKVELKENAKPDIYIDGKKYDYAILKLLDQSKIASMNVIKDEMALKEYNAPNGVILIKSKGTANEAVSIEADEIKFTPDDSKEPMIIIDGKVRDKTTLEKLTPNQIESVSVFKGQQAIDKYNAPNGAIVVKTKQ